MTAGLSVFFTAVVQVTFNVLGCSTNIWKAQDNGQEQGISQITGSITSLICDLVKSCIIILKIK